MFKPADPTRRTPVWLQNGTRENIVWQLKVTGLVLLYFWAKDKLDERRGR